MVTKTRFQAPLEITVGGRKLDLIESNLHGSERAITYADKTGMTVTFAMRKTGLDNPMRAPEVGSITVKDPKNKREYIYSWNSVIMFPQADHVSFTVGGVCFKESAIALDDVDPKSLLKIAKTLEASSAEIRENYCDAIRIAEDLHKLVPRVFKGQLTEMPKHLD